MNPEMATLPNLMPVMPEMLLSVGAVMLLMLGVFGGNKVAQAINGLSVALLIIAGVLLLLVPNETADIFGGVYIQDPFAKLLKIVVLVSAGLVQAMSVGYSQVERFERFEFPVLILLSSAGMMVMLSANDMIAAYMGLELLAICLYVLAAIRKDSIRATEAAMKFYVLGAISSALLLFGMSLVYGASAQTTFGAIADALQIEDNLGPATMGMTFILAALAFRISAVPFHLWTSDVYEGTPTPVAAFLATAPMVAAMGLIVRFTMTAFEPMDGVWQQIIMLLAILSMVVGAFSALGQSNIKRLMASTAVNHMGFALVGLAAGSAAGIVGVVIYLIVYSVMTLGAFATIFSMRSRDGMLEYVDDLAGLARTNLPMAFSISILMLSLAGVPWLGGFLAKWFVFSAAMEAGLYPVAVIGVLASVITAFSYLRIVRLVFAEEPSQTIERPLGEIRLVMLFSALFLFTMVVFAGSIRAIAEAATSSFF